MSTTARHGDIEDIATALQRALESAGLSPADDAAWAARDAEVAAQRKAAEDAERRAVLEHRARELLEPQHGFPVRALQHAMAPTDTEAMRVVRDWKWRQRNVLVLSGAAGVGKTVAACFPALQSAATWRFVGASEFFASSRYDREARDRLFSSALVLDDLGTEYQDSKGSAAADLDELADRFYASRRPLIITTNISAADLPVRYPLERVLSRWRECAVWRELGASTSLRPPPRGGQR